MAVENINLGKILITDGIQEAVDQGYPLIDILDAAEAMTTAQTQQSNGGLTDVSRRRDIHNALRAAVLKSDDDMRLGELNKLAVEGRIT